VKAAHARAKHGTNIDQPFGLFLLRLTIKHAAAFEEAFKGRNNIVEEE